MIDKLINLNIEIEGLLRVIKDRNDDKARELLQEKFDEFSVLYYNTFTVLPEVDVDTNVDNHDIATEPVPVSEPAPFTAPLPSPSPSPAPTLGQDSPSPRTKTAPFYAPSPYAQSTVNQDPQMSPQPQPVLNDVVVRPVRRPDIVHAFTVNDKFNFLRTIFNGDSAYFNDTIMAISAMDSLDQVFDYLYNNLALSDEDDNVSAFVSIIARQFNSLA